MKKRLLSAADDVQRVLRSVKARELTAFKRVILDSNRIFVTGLGRTGLMARGFAMRLMHLGRRVYHVGDVITPAIKKGDLLIICSRTARSRVLAYYIDIAKKAKAAVAVVTANGSSRVARSADVTLTIDDRPTLQARKRRHATYLPLGSLFEQALLLVLDGVVVALMEDLKLIERDLARVHTSFE
ncbi:MAG: 6-phospho-3-hexuloisomerase [Planctomycetota bacterium]